MEYPNEYLMPWIISNVVSIGLILLSHRSYKAGVIVWSLLFAGAGIFNLCTVLREPEAYLMYQEWAIPIYRKFINGFFTDHTAAVVSIIAIGQILVAVALWVHPLRPFALIGGIIFMLSISPLGWGSAFPAPLLMAWSMLILFRRFRKGQ